MNKTKSGLIHLRSFFIAGVLFCCMLFLTACPYESKFTLGKANACAIDSALLGEWIGSDTATHPGDDSIYMNVFAFNDHEYYINFGEKKNGVIKKDDHLRAFETKIGSIRFMNITGLGEGKWSFYKFVFAGNKLKVCYLTDKFIKDAFKSSEEFNAFVTKNIKDPKMFEDDITFRKLN